MTLGGALLAMFACGRPRACPNTRTLVAAELPNGAYAEIQRGLVEYRDDVPVPQGDGNITEHTPAPCGPSCSPTIPDLVMGLCVFETEWACPPIKLLPTDRDLEDNHDSFYHRTRYRLTMLIMTTVGVRILSQGAAVCCSGFRKAFRSENETDTAKDKWYFAASTAVTFSNIYCAVFASILTLAWYTDGLSARSGMLSEVRAATMPVGGDMPIIFTEVLLANFPWVWPRMDFNKDALFLALCATITLEIGAEKGKVCWVIFSFTFFVLMFTLKRTWKDPALRDELHVEHDKICKPRIPGSSPSMMEVPSDADGPNLELPLVFSALGRSVKEDHNRSARIEATHALAKAGALANQEAW